MKKPRFFIMTGAEAIALIPDKRKQKKSWTTNKSPGWSWRKAPTAIVENLRPYEDRWECLRARLQSSHAATASKIGNPGK